MKKDYLTNRLRSVFCIVESLIFHIKFKKNKRTKFEYVKCSDCEASCECFKLKNKPKCSKYRNYKYRYNL